MRASGRPVWKWKPRDGSVATAEYSFRISQRRLSTSISGTTSGVLMTLLLRSYPGAVLRTSSPGIPYRDGGLDSPDAVGSRPLRRHTRRRGRGSRPRPRDAWAPLPDDVA